jgi:hypothetical protein
MRIAVAVLALTLTASAAAKGPDHASICGASRCFEVNGDIKVYSLLDWQGKPFMVVDAPKPAPYYAISLRNWGKILYLPTRNLIRVWQGPHAYGEFAPGSSSAPYWRVLPNYLRTTYTKLVRGLKPRTAPSHWPS